jgi:hypothetical protein
MGAFCGLPPRRGGRDRAICCTATKLLTIHCAMHIVLEMVPKLRGIDADPTKRDEVQP